MPQLDKYTPTNKPIAKTLTVVEECGFENLLSPPGKAHKQSGKIDKTKYCRFHKDHDHDTSTCYVLKDQIEDLVRRGYLKKYAGSRDRDEPTASTKDNNRERSRTPPQLIGDRPVVINTIADGPSGGQSGQKRKTLIQEATHVVCTS